MFTLFQENEFPFFVPESSKITIVGPVEKLFARSRRLTCEQVHEVVAIKVDFECLPIGLVALQQLLDNIRFACGRQKRCSPILMRANIVDDSPRLDQTWPAND